MYPSVDCAECEDARVICTLFQLGLAFQKVINLKAELLHIIRRSDPWFRPITFQKDSFITDRKANPKGNKVWIVLLRCGS